MTGVVLLRLATVFFFEENLATVTLLNIPSDILSEFRVMWMSYVGGHHAKALVATTAIENLMHHSTVRETSKLLSSWI